MLCEVCGEREATIHLTTIADSTATIQYVCDVCGPEPLELPPYESDPAFEIASLQRLIERNDVPDPVRKAVLEQIERLRKRLPPDDLPAA